MATNRHTFTFLVEGIALSDTQKEQISKAVGEAGATALSDTIDPSVRCLIGPYFWGYRGRPAYDLAAFADVNVGELVQRTESQLGVEDAGI
jgi:hypothetical protein